MVKSPAELMLERETRVSYGPVPTFLYDRPLDEMSWQMHEGTFLLRAEGEHYFLYRPGEGVTVHRGADADASEESLWLNGSVYAAVASMNGLLPIHASAVAHAGAVFAFTGPGGAGKSTLTAALSRHGLPMFCDDTLVLDLADPDRVMCLPGHKRLKLRHDAFALTGTAREEKVSRTYDKYYAAPAAGPYPGKRGASRSEDLPARRDDHRRRREDTTRAITIGVRRACPATRPGSPGGPRSRPAPQAPPGGCPGSGRSRSPARRCGA